MCVFEISGVPYIPVLLTHLMTLAGKTCTIYLFTVILSTVPPVPFLNMCVAVIQLQEETGEHIQTQIPGRASSTNTRVKEGLN